MSRNITTHRQGPNPRTPSFRTMIRLYSTGAFLLLTASEGGVLWLLYSHHIFSTSTLTQAAIAIPIINLLLIGAAVACIAAPLATYRYTQAVQKDLQPGQRVYTQLPTRIGTEEIPTDCANVPADSQLDSVSAIIQRQQEPILVLSPRGGGKTSELLATQYSIVQHPWKLIWGNSLIPVYISMSDYNTSLKAWNSQLDENATIQGTLLDHLSYESNTAGIRYLRSYLHRWAKQGRLLFLCDDIHTIDQPFLGFICAHLLHIMEKEQNQVVMSSRTLDYQAQPQLQQLTVDGSVLETSILPLHSTQLRDFVEQYINVGNTDQSWHYTTDEIMQLIEQLHMDDQCLTPGTLLTLMRTLNRSKGTDLDTCSRLYHEFLSQLIQTELEKPKWRERAFEH